MLERLSDKLFVQLAQYAADWPAARVDSGLYLKRCGSRVILTSQKSAWSSTTKARPHRDRASSKNVQFYTSSDSSFIFSKARPQATDMESKYSGMISDFMLSWV